MSAPMSVLSLFAGIGGFDLGLERTGGFKTVAFCEIDPFCRRVLAKHWPGVPCYEDVRELSAERLDADGIAVDVICGGFPCQGISIAGKGAGLADPRSAMWFEMLRIIGEVRPRIVIAENSPRLRSRGLDIVLWGLNAVGYDAEWHCLPAAYVGAPHRRDRIWIIAYRKEDALGPYANRIRSYQAQMHVGRGAELLDEQERDLGSLAWRSASVPVQRVVDGVPSRLDISRLKAVGNAVVPQIPELIGRAILAAESQRVAT